MFVPSLLKPTFERDGVRTVNALFSLQPNHLKHRPSWGERKIALLVALQKLYRDLASCEGLIDDFLLVCFVDSKLLPDASMREMTFREVINTTADELQLEGRFSDDFDGLRRLFMHHAAVSDSTQAAAGAYLRGVEHADMDWRDVPLNVSYRK